MRQLSRARSRQIGFSIILASGLVLSGCASKPGSDALPPPPPPPPLAPPPPPPPPPMAYPNVASPVMADAVMSSRAMSKAAPVPGSAYIPPIVVPTEPDNERYDGQEVNPVKQVASEPVSTFSVDVDTGAYANMRRFLNSGITPPRDAVRTEEFINYFRYDYAKPDSKEAPFSLTTDMAVTPWNSNTRLLRIGLRGYDIPHASRPPANLVFLLDVSGSMGDPDKLPLLKSALNTLTNELGPRDKVSIVVYAGAAGLVLEPTSDKAQIRRALDQLSAGGSTAGGAGIQLAYQVAQDNRIEGGVNRVILATDGDFNVGTTDTKSLIELVERNRDSGVTLTTLGFGQGNYNEALMEQVADHGNGNYAYIDSATEAQKVLSDEMSSTLFTIAGDVKIQVEFNPSFVSEYRLIGYENRILRREDFNNDKVDAGDIGAGHQVTALYEIVPAGTKGWADPLRYSENPPAMGPKGSEFGFVKLRYKLPGQSKSILIDRPLSAAWLAGAAAPRGDFAFATAVAAFGQKLRGDSLLGSYSFGDIEKLAGPQSNFWRQEFVKLVQIAEGQTGR